MEKSSVCPRPEPAEPRQPNDQLHGCSRGRQPPGGWLAQWSPGFLLRVQDGSECPGEGTGQNQGGHGGGQPRPPGLRDHRYDPALL